MNSPLHGNGTPEGPYLRARMQPQLAQRHHSAHGIYELTLPPRATNASRELLSCRDEALRSFCSSITFKNSTKSIYPLPSSSTLQNVKRCLRCGSASKHTGFQMTASDG